MPKNKKSTVWNYFTKKDQNFASCNYNECNQKISVQQGNTSTMRRHLLSIHNIDVEKDEYEKAPKHSKMLDNFLVKTSLEEIVSKMAAVDGFSIRKITQSEFIRQSLSLRGMKLPADEKSVMALVHKFMQKVKQQVIKDFQQDLSESKKFSITLDEWTSVGNRRFLNINLHTVSLKCINLGVVRILGSCDAMKMIQLVEEHLKSFGLSFKHDIVASTGDGASVMIKFGRESFAIYQICLDHGLHLAVTKTFYEEIFLTEGTAEEDLGETDNFDEINDDLSFDEIEAQNVSESFSFKENINIVRQIAIFFKNSAVRSDLFKSKCREKFQKEQQLSLDCKTRWNSMLKMLETFIKLYDVTKEALNELGSEHLLTNLNLELIKSIALALKPVEVTLNAMSEKKATLRTAYIAINFMREKLNEQESDISRALLKNIDHYINNRINCGIMDLMNSLNNLNKIPSKASIELATVLMNRLFPSSNTSSDEETVNDIQLISNDEVPSLEDELRVLLEAPIATPPRVDRFKKLRQEFSLSKSNGELTDNLKRLLDAINTIKPTSIDSERAFSVANNFCTKIRSRLSDKSLHALVFLKYYFINKNI